MFRKLHYNVAHYFSKKPKKTLIELFFQFGIMDLAISAITIFEPIYLFILGYSLRQILLFYILVYGLYFLLLPLGGKFIGRFGFERSILVSSFFLIFYYLSLYAIPHAQIFFLVATMMFALQKTFYWSAYHLDFYESCCRRDLGKDVSSIWALDALIYVIGPTLGGAILGFWGFNVLFLVVAALILISNLPLYFSQQEISKQEFIYKDFFQIFFDRKHRRHLIGLLGFGEELIVMVLWPIFIYLAIKKYLEIGEIISLAALVTAMISLVVGKIADKSRKISLLHFGVIGYFVAWLFRGLVQTPFQVLSTDTLSRVSKNTLFVPLDAMVYEDADRHKPLKYLVFYESGLSLGKISAALVIYLILGLTTNWIVIFTMAGLFALLYLFYHRT